MSSTKKPKSFVCSYCEKTFSFHNQLVVHIRQHTGEKPFQCEICHKSFASLKVLKVHERVHTGERPYKCPYCEKSFSAYANLVVHRRIHTHEKPYQCKLCKRAFEHSGNLSRHFRAHMTDFGFRCILCSRIFEKDFELLEHTKIDHSNEYLSYTLNHNNNNNAANKNKTRGNGLASSTERENISNRSYIPLVGVQNEIERRGTEMQNNSQFSNSCSLNEISSTTEVMVPKKWRTKHAHLKQYLKSAADLYPFYNNESKNVSEERFSKSSLSESEMSVDSYSPPIPFDKSTPHDEVPMEENINRDRQEEPYLPKHLKFKKFVNSYKDNFKYYTEPSSYNDDIDIVYDMRKQSLSTTNPPPLIPIEKARFDNDNKYPVDLSFHVRRSISSEDRSPSAAINDGYENLYPSTNLEIEEPKIDSLTSTPLPETFQPQLNEALFETPHFMKGMLQRTNVFNFYVSELKKFTFRKKVEKVLCALLGKTKLKDFGYPEKSCEQVRKCIYVCR